jgi:hypothetical protein
MKNLIKAKLQAYCQRAYAAAQVCETYAAEVGFEMGFTDPWQHKKNRELDKYRQKVEFPAEIGIVPVAIFSVGVTFRLITSTMCSLVLRAGYASHIKNGK